MFRNLFLVLVPGADPAGRVVHADELSETTIVPVPSAAVATAVAASFGAVSLIELYGGLGFETAAAVLAVAPGVPVGFPGLALPPVASAVLFEDPEPGRWTFGATTVMTVQSVASVAPVAVSLVAAGAERVELCGGMGPVPAAEVAAAVDVPVTTVLFGFESLPPAVAYRTRFEEALSQRPNG
ncbi:DUF6506 family protein [Actinophytocola sp.]|uniref:DUF6506 family protein n=1 Tax=Actinophytocola sp. TaxID=1872138 RepID=UPI002D4F2F5E|nr:DUF6506 family protein [Actinophytocola sp.]HYQ69020.1 DUF6506 family protein [Actinophytocola sp.]